MDLRLHAAAGRSLWAHLIHMAKGGRVTVDGEATLEATYRLGQGSSPDPSTDVSRG